MCDAVIAGSGPAGLSAALQLGRQRRGVMITDTGEGRNAVSHASHGFFTRDGTPPQELRRMGREQLAAYPSVTLRDAAVLDARRDDDGFALTLATGETIRSRTVILATGVRDELPAIPGLAEQWGGGVVSCPFCDGWELRDRPLAVLLGAAHQAMRVAMIHHLSRDLVVMTNSEIELDDDTHQLTDAEGIAVVTEPIARVEGDGDRLSRLVLASGETIEREAMFIMPSMLPRNDLAVQLGCEVAIEGPMPGMVVVDQMLRTSVPGVFASGDVTTPMAQVSAAAASGGMAGASAHHHLLSGTLTRAADGAR